MGIAVTVVDGAGSTVISDNIIHETSQGAIIGYRWHNAVTGDLSRGAANRWPHLTIQRNRTS